MNNPNAVSSKLKKYSIPNVNSRAVDNSIKEYPDRAPSSQVGGGIFIGPLYTVRPLYSAPRKILSWPVPREEIHIREEVLIVKFSFYFGFDLSQLNQFC
jgi:hypothetical protein